MRREYFKIWAALLILVTSTTVRSGDLPALLIFDYSSREVILREPLAYGRSFAIRYIHSVDRSPVFEIFRVEKGEGLILEETGFRMFGAGMGHWEGHGKLVREGDWTKIKDINRTLGSFILRVGSLEVAHTVVVDDKEWNLSQVAAGRRVVVMISEE